MGETYYGEWIGIRDEWPEGMPDGSEWEADLVYGRHPEPCIEWMGRLIGASGEVGAVDSNRIRRVYPPGSVLPEPREVISMIRSVVSGWKHWMLLDQQESYPRWEYREDAVYLPGFLGYPVQPLQNGAFVPVPWSAVEVVK